MIRILAATALCLVATPALAQVVDDFDCTSDLAGPETPAGILRISSDGEFAWLDADTALPGPFYPFELTEERVTFPAAFAEQVAPGAQLIEASYFADAATFEAVLFTSDARVVMVSCPYVY